MYRYFLAPWDGGGKTGPSCFEKSYISPRSGALASGALYFLAPGGEVVLTSGVAL